MVSRRTRVVSWIFRRDHPSRPKAMICCFFSSFKTFAMLREATDPPAAVNVLDVSSKSMAAFQVFTYGRFWVFTEGDRMAGGMQDVPHDAKAIVFILDSETKSIVLKLFRELPAKTPATASVKFGNKLPALRHSEGAFGRRRSLSLATRSRLIELLSWSGCSVFAVYL
jgi:hypothetical protein